MPPYKVTELGIAHVPEGRQVFPELTVKENLEIGAYIPSAKAERARTLDLVFKIFPVLAERRKQLAGTMSGGEQQMLAVGRGLMLKPRLLMLDEPSLGLAPVVTDATFEKIQEIHAMGTAILLVEQNVSRALTLVRARLCARERQSDHARHERRVGKQQAGASGLSRPIGTDADSTAAREVSRLLKCTVFAEVPRGVDDYAPAVPAMRWIYKAGGGNPSL